MGLKLLVDLHYSGTWADPGNQNKPAAWTGHNISQLQSDVYEYTYDVCNSLKSQGSTPDSVRIGNEINVGMLWNEGKIVDNDFTNLSPLLKSANARWFYDGIKAKRVDWDITGLPYCCPWHGTITDMGGVVADDSTADSITSGCSGYPLSWQGQG